MAFYRRQRRFRLPRARWLPGKASQPAFAAAINFRSTSGFVTDDAGQTYCITDAGGLGELYPINRGGLTFGWLSSGPYPEGRNRDSGIDPRFAGIHFVGAPTQRTFQLDLPSTGNYAIRLSFGDAGNNDQTVYFELYDDTNLLTSQGETLVLGGRYMDATGVVRTSISDWISNNSAYTAAFTSTKLLLKIGFSSGSNFTTLTHLSVVSLAGSASISPSGSASPSASVSPSHSVSPSFSQSPSASISPSGSVSPSASTSPSSSASPSAGAPQITFLEAG